MFRHQRARVRHALARRGRELITKPTIIPQTIQSVRHAIPAIWLSKPIERLLTEPLRRRSITPRRSSDGGCCLFRTLLPVIPRAGTRTAPFTPTPDSFQSASSFGLGPFETRVLMAMVGRRTLFPFLMPIPAPPASPVLAPHPIRTSETPFSLSTPTPPRRSY